MKLIKHFYVLYETTWGLRDKDSKSDVTDELVPIPVASIKITVEAKHENELRQSGVVETVSGYIDL